MRTHNRAVMRVGFIAGSIQLVIWVCLFFVALGLQGSADFDHLTWIYTYTIAFFPWILFLRLPMWDIFQLIPVNAGWIWDYVTNCALSMVNWFINGCLVAYLIERIKNNSKSRSIDPPREGSKAFVKQRWKDYAFIFFFSAVFYVAILSAFMWTLIGIGDSMYSVSSPMILGILKLINFSHEILIWPSHFLKAILNVNDYGVSSLILFSSCCVVIYHFSFRNERRKALN